MYTILVSQSDDELKKTLKTLCSDIEHVHITNTATSPECQEILFCCINTAKGIYNIPYEDILFVESGQKKSIFHLTRKNLYLPIPLYRIREALPEPRFIQTHRSFIINLKNVAYIDKTKDPWVISFFNSEQKAFVSRSFKKNVMQTINPSLNCIND